MTALLALQTSSVFFPSGMWDRILYQTVTKVLFNLRWFSFSKQNKKREGDEKWKIITKKYSAFFSQLKRKKRTSNKRNKEIVFLTNKRTLPTQWHFSGVRNWKTCILLPVCVYSPERLCIASMGNCLVSAITKLKHKYILMCQLINL